MSSNAKKIVNSEATKALWERLAYYTVGIAGIDENFEPGTGIPIKYKEKYFIVTCSHIVKQVLPDNIRFNKRTNEPLIYKEKDKLNEGMKDPSFRYNEMFSLPIKRIILPISKDIDLAGIELDETVKEKGIDFFELSNANVMTPKTGLRVHLLGFAGEIAQPFEDIKENKKGYVRFLLQEVTEIVPDNESAPNFQPSHEFLMKYYADYKPEGMSGCGIWSFEKKILGLVWRVEPKLVGMQCSVCRSSKVLYGEKAEMLFELLN